MYLANENRYTVADQTQFEQIPGAPIAYWVSEQILSIFSHSPLKKYGKTTKGLITGNNERFIRNWWEPSFLSVKVDAINSGETFCEAKWYPCSKGGEYRKWFGNLYYVVLWKNNGYEILNPKANEKRHFQDYYDYMKFQPMLTWSSITSGSSSFRLTEKTIIEHAGMAIYVNENEFRLPVLSFLNSSVSDYLLSILSPTLNLNAGEIERLPISEFTSTYISVKSGDCIAISKQDWDAHETSWDFQRNGLLDIDTNKAMSIVSDYSDVTGICIDMATPEPTKLEWLLSMNQMNWEAKFFRLHANEEELNRQFIEIYGLQDELTPDVPLEDITILQQGEIKIKDAEEGYVLNIEGGSSIPVTMPKRIEWQNDVVIKQLISYMVGVWMGRYRLDRPGLNIAHPDPTDEEMASYQYGPDNATLVIDEDAIIPILPTGAPFEDNLTEYIANFVRIVWGEESQTDNLNFIEQYLGKKIEDYVQKDFWKDHKKMYQNRPIYWLFSSKKGAFKALVYVHRMHPYTVEQVRTRYLLKYMDWLRSEAQRLEIRDTDLTTAERRRLDRLRTDIEECEEYHERLQVVAEQAIPINLDNGIPANHALFGDILTKLK